LFGCAWTGVVGAHIWAARLAQACSAEFMNSAGSSGKRTQERCWSRTGAGKVFMIGSASTWS